MFFCLSSYVLQQIPFQLYEIIYHQNDIFSSVTTQLFRLQIHSDLHTTLNNTLLVVSRSSTIVVKSK